MKIAVFGSTGFIGKNIVKSLQQNFSIQEISLRNASWKTDLDKKTEVFINLIGKAHDHKGTATEKEYYFANVELAQQLFEVFKKSEASLFIHISSLAALEEFESDRALTENDPCNPVSVYGKSKREAEKWLLEQSLPEGKKLLIIRPPMVHGPGDKGNLGLLYKIISKGIPYPLASFDNSRSFISIDNFTFYILQMIENKNHMENGVYHIADDETIATSEIIEVIKKVENLKTPNISLPRFLVKGIARCGDFLPLPLNTKKLKKLTNNLLVSNQKIKIALKIDKLPLTAKEGLEQTIKSFRK
ncbi:MAG: NAD-dependent epimerase/dehydratase family protein [Chryseobacterium sp.]|jgi:nucleoside-diphosphate-sugar epimerase|uniref:NAD-dependent epimerase/dehydratase family protein n=1 Tax=Chryseobacterium sp. TaxID=1871047 RepID=UPI00281BE1AE|nr:NAD-dependent epimerase/dehydratase family protein [Chryseobacterium sp.]MDR2236518.1 NAD-dependent epimerase/dehydratase family protein [Chryseobacterium sp.]